MRAENSPRKWAWNLGLKSLMCRTVAKMKRLRRSKNGPKNGTGNTKKTKKTKQNYKKNAARHDFRGPPFWTDMNMKMTIFNVLVTIAIGLKTIPSFDDSCVFRVHERSHIDV